MKRIILVAAAILALVSAPAVNLAEARDGKGQRAAAPRASAPARRAVQRPAARAHVQRRMHSQRRHIQRHAAPRIHRSQGLNRSAASVARSKRQAQQRTRERRQQTVQPRSPDQAISREARREQIRQREREGKQAQRGGSNRQLINRTQITNQQRLQVRQTIFKQRKVDRISRKKLNFALTVGSRVPRHHRRHLHRFSPALFAFAAFYHGYDYLVVEDTICIVDPESYVIVDVIPASAERAEGPPGPVLALSPEQMRFVYDNTPKDPARTDLRLRLALGAEIPRNLELFRFPEDVLARIPQLESFRYIVVDTDIVVVNPADRSIALIISQ
jgi:hypothetical protein